jgi:GTP-binding protein EngB required for normal cell division
VPAKGAASQRRRTKPGARPAAAAFPRAAAQFAAAGPDDLQAVAELSARLMALARMIQIGTARTGGDGFSKKLLAVAEEVLGRAGERMRLSSSHTVVVLAGGTGSGKSSLFNQLARADFSTVGVTRPVTMEAHACIWGATGSGALLDWLSVPARYRYSRASALDRGEADLAGLVLLDLPDHDSVMSHAGDPVERLVGMADVMIWVLDPQKYADAAVHRRFLIPMAGHSDVLAVVLNQVDLLDSAQIDDCVADLRRLLDSEDLPDVPILVTSAVTGTGMDELRTLLVDGVAARRASTIRIAADVDGVVATFVPLGGPADAQARVVPSDAREQLAARFTEAAGVTAVSDALRGARELRAADFVGWPVAWLSLRLAGRDPMRKVRLGALWEDLRSVSAGPAGAQQAEVDNALTEFGDTLAASLPRPWTQTVRTAVRSRSDAISAAIGSAIGEALPAEDSVVSWWRLAGLWQGLLLGVAGVALAWMVVVTILALTRSGSGSPPSLLNDAGVLPWLAGCVVAALGLGAGTAAVSMSTVRKEAEAESARAADDMRQRIADVASEMVIMPAEQELSEFERYREELAIAERSMRPGPAPQDQAS